MSRWRDWIKHLDPKFLQRERDEEANRIGNDAAIFRYFDRLYLARDDGGLVTLADCPFGDGMHLYIYEHFDGGGRFYVVRRHEYENLHYVLVSRKTGLTFAFTSIPEWSPDHTRFVTGRCSAMNGPDAITISRPSGDGFQTEATVSLPCKGGGNCTFAWTTDSEISLSCTSPQSDVMQRFRVVRQGDTWTRLPN